jgi:acetyl-CoA carboxylase biotin carboxyl carrier protein
MDLRTIKKLIELLEESQLTELEVKMGEETVRLSRAVQVAAPAVQHVAAAPVVATPSAAGAPAAPAVKRDPDALPEGNVVRSPMVGTFYTSRSPDAPAFVQVGAQVKAGDPLCIIEAMKMFNAIDSDFAGTVVKILVENGKPVEFDQPLFVIR